MSWQVALILTCPQLISALAAVWYSRRTHQVVSHDVTPRLQTAATVQGELRTQVAEVSDTVHLIAEAGSDQQG